MRSVLFSFNFELMLLFNEYFKIVLERFRSSLLHYRYMDVVRACPETQLDYSNYISYSVYEIDDFSIDYTFHLTPSTDVRGRRFLYK
jgi:hypothetical protein